MTLIFWITKFCKVFDSSFANLFMNLWFIVLLYCWYNHRSEYIIFVTQIFLKNITNLSRIISIYEDTFVTNQFSLIIVCQQTTRIFVFKIRNHSFERKFVESRAIGRWHIFPRWFSKTTPASIDLDIYNNRNNFASNFT